MTMMAAQAPAAATVAARELDALLTGKTVRLSPYVRGFWPPDTLYALWKILCEEHAAPKLFFGRPGSPTMPYRIAGDLVDFLRMFEPEGAGARILLIAQHLASGQIAGFFWFDDLQPHRAAGSVFYRRRFWGTPAREASWLALRYGFRELNIESVWAYSPWHTGQRHALAAGFREVARLPQYVLVEGAPTDLAVLRLTRDEFEGRT